MKLAIDRGVELSLEDLAQIRGGARVRVYSSNEHLNQLSRALRQHATGVLDPLDVLMVRASHSQSAAADVALPGGARELGVDGSQQHIRRLRAL